MLLHNFADLCYLSFKFRSAWALMVIIIDASSMLIINRLFLWTSFKLESTNTEEVTKPLPYNKYLFNIVKKGTI